MSVRFRKYFHYKHLEDLRSEVGRLGVDMTFEEHIEALAQPAQLGQRRIGNRFAIHPMEGCDAAPDGSPGELTVRRWHRFAAGGAKLLWGEATAVVPEGRANPRQLLINQANLPAIAALLASTKKIHRIHFGTDDDFLVGLQLTHSGRWSHGRPVIAYHHRFIDQRTFVDAARSQSIDASYPVITDAELDRLTEAYLSAIHLAAVAGFDFVDIKQCHTYLLSELLSATKREGPYGGSLENRMRFVRTILDANRAEHPEIQIASRINVYDGIPFRAHPESHIGEPGIPGNASFDGFGLHRDYPWHPDLTEPMSLVRMMYERGVRLINISLGSPYYNPHIGRPYDRPNDGGYLPPEHPLLGVERHFVLSEAVQRAFPDLLTVGTGYSWLQKYSIFAGESNIRRGRISFMGLGRGALAYPDYAVDALKHGTLDSKKVCLSVSFCTDLMRSKQYEHGQAPAGCVPRDELYAKIYKDINSEKEK